MYIIYEYVAIRELYYFNNVKEPKFIILDKHILTHIITHCRHDSKEIKIQVPEQIYNVTIHSKMTSTYKNKIVIFLVFTRKLILMYILFANKKLLRNPSTHDCT